MFKRAAAVIIGLMVATTSVAGDGKQNGMGQGMAPNMGSGAGPGMTGMMGRNMAPRAGAGGKAMMPDMRGGHQRGPGPFAGVQFSEAQRQQIQKMMAKERVVNQERRRKMQKVQQNLQKLYSADRWDVDAISKAYDALFAEQKRTVVAMVTSRNQIYEMLTGEQKAQMKRVQAAQQKRRQQMRQQRMEQLQKQQPPPKQ